MDGVYAGNRLDAYTDVGGRATQDAVAERLQRISYIPVLTFKLLSPRMECMLKIVRNDFSKIRTPSA